MKDKILIFNKKIYLKNFLYLNQNLKNQKSILIHKFIKKHLQIVDLWSDFIKAENFVQIIDEDQRWMIWLTFCLETGPNFLLDFLNMKNLFFKIFEKIITKNAFFNFSNLEIENLDMLLQSIYLEFEIFEEENYFYEISKEILKNYFKYCMQNKIIDEFLYQEKLIIFYEKQIKENYKVLKNFTTYEINFFDECENKIIFDFIKNFNI